MTTQENLVLGRLRRAAVVDGQVASDGASATTYGASRLGLVPRTQRPAPTRPVETAEVYRKRTFKLPVSQLARLKAYAKVTEQYQYRLVNDAVTQFLERAAAMLGYEQRSAMDKLQQQFLLEQADPRVVTPFCRQRPIQQKANPPTDVEPAATPSFHWWWTLRRLVHLREKPQLPARTSSDFSRSTLPRASKGV